MPARKKTVKPQSPYEETRHNYTPDRPDSIDTLITYTIDTFRRVDIALGKLIAADAAHENNYAMTNKRVETAYETLGNQTKLIKELQQLAERLSRRIRTLEGTEE